MRVYHFVSSVYAISNLALKRLKVSQYNQLNDPFELLAATPADPVHQQAHKRFLNQMHASTGAICFSSGWSNPLLWGHYADKHSGMALGFDVPDGVCEKITYRPDRVKIEIDPTTGNVVDGESAMRQLLLTKFSDWKYEKEYRSFYDLDTLQKEGGNYFVGFSPDLILKEVVLGWKCEHSISEIKQLLGSDAAKVKVVKASIDPMKFKVVKTNTARTKPSLKKIVIIAGPSGAGKTTFARNFLLNEGRTWRFINADLIAAGLAPFMPYDAYLKASRLMLEEIDECVEAGESFAFATTLHDLAYLKKITYWQQLGYHVELWFLSLPNADAAVSRVAHRVAQGGHDIPEHVIRRQFNPGIKNFHEHYRTLVNSWALYDNSGHEPKLLEWSDK